MRKTEKLRKAKQLTNELGFLNIPDDRIYLELNRLGYTWNTKKQSWILVKESSQPTDLIYIRVWAKLDDCEQLTNEIVEGLPDNLKLQNRSDVYPCRPPKQQEGRIYLTLSKK